jgi:hypothetical protein
LDRINDNIKKKFAPYAGEKFYDDVKDISLKITEYLISENSRLYD